MRGMFSHLWVESDPGGCYDRLETRWMLQFGRRNSTGNVVAHYWRAVCYSSHIFLCF